MPQKKNDLPTLLFFIIGLLAVVDLTYVSVKQQQNVDQAREKLDCVVQVVEALQAKAPVPQCEIAWDK